MSSDSRLSIAGLSVLTVMVLFTAVWMHMQSEDRAAPATMPAVAAEVELPDAPLAGFVEIAAGPFRMGSDPAADRMAYANERWSASAYQGVVDLPTFYIGRDEVTVAEFRAFLRATGRPANAVAEAGKDRFPVTNVSWTDALAYARWLQESVRSSPALAPQLAALFDAGWTLTLPNEAQWEKAARGSDGRVFPWGNTPDAENANVGSDGTRPVGSIACEDCSYGLNDMSGNVWELTRSPLRDYPFDPAGDGAIIDGDALYVMRGGSFSDTINNARAATRGGVDPGARRDNIGFRLVLERAVLPRR